MSFSVGQCVLNLPGKYGNRLDLAYFTDSTVTIGNQFFGFNPINKAVLAVVQAIQAITETYEFEELKYVTPQPPLTTLALTQGQPLVSIASLLATIPQQAAQFPQFQNQNILDITDVYAFWMWFSGPGGASSPNQAGRLLDYRRIPTADTYSYGITSNTQGVIGTAPPVYFSRFGANLQVAPAPNLNYDFFVRVKLRHPFPVGTGGFSAVAGFIPAQLQSVLTGTAVTSVTVVYPGQGYPASTTIPVYFVRNGGGPLDGAVITTSTATGTATTNAQGGITSVAITAGGSYNNGGPSCSTIQYAGQQVFMPDSWQEGVEYTACWKIALGEGTAQFIAMFEEQMIRNGIDPNLLRKSQMERDEKHNTRALSLRTSRYTFA